MEYRQNCQWGTEAYDQRQLADGDFVFRRQVFPLPMTPGTFTWRFKKILREHGLPDTLNVHSLRHTNASLLIADGTDVTTVAGLLGHSQPSTTLDIYSHAFDKNKKRSQPDPPRRVGDLMEVLPMQVLSDLWYGNIAPHERPIPASKEYRQMLKTLSGLGERIREMVSPEQKELLDEYERLYM